MSYTLSMINSKADCQAMINQANKDRRDLSHRKEGLSMQVENSSSSSVSIESDLAAATAEVNALQTVVAGLPDGPVKDETNVKLTKAAYKKFLLEQRKGSYGPVSFVQKEYDIACLEQSVAETDAFIQALTVRLDELPAA